MIAGGRVGTGQDVARLADVHLTLRRDGTDVEVLRGIDLAIGRGEILGLVGESGSGKSVLALALMGLLPADAHPRLRGDLTVAGVDMARGPVSAQRAARRDHLGVIFQDPMTSLNPTMRIGRQITEVSGSDTASARLLGQVGVPDADQRLRVYPHQLSGGLRQRVMTAIALSGSPALIIADEPTTALDVTIQAQVLALLRDLRDEFGCSVLFITHDLAVAAQITDRMGVMYAGRLAELGPTADVLMQPSHPYTAGLLGSKLSLRMPRSGTLRTLPPGTARVALAAVGCAYQARCPLALDRCATEVPGWETVGTATHGRACWRPVTDVRAEPGGGGVDEVAVATVSGEPSQPAAAPAGLPAVVRVTDLRVTFGGRRSWGRTTAFAALDGVDLTVGAGEAVSVVGESGSGKSTLLRVLAGLVSPSSGSAHVEGATQMVFQDAGSSLTPWLTVGELLRERLRPLRLSPQARTDRVTDSLSRMGLPAALATVKPGQLSGGQRQRVALARATIVPPTVLLCDEPTSALDASLAATVLNLIRGMRADLGMAVVFVTHDLSVARLMGDRIAVMRAGRLVEVGEAEALCTEPAHDYTRALLAAVPELDGPAHGKQPLAAAFADTELADLSATGSAR